MIAYSLENHFILSPAYLIQTQQFKLLTIVVFVVFGSQKYKQSEGLNFWTKFISEALINCLRCVNLCYAVTAPPISFFFLGTHI